MSDSYPQITPEQREAIAASGGLPVYLEDPDTHKLYLVFEQPVGTSIDDNYIRDAITAGVEALEAGERRLWDPDFIKREGRRRLDARKASE